MDIKNKLTEKQAKWVIANVKATLAMEDLDLTDEEVEILEKYAKGELTQKEIFKIFEV